MTDQFTPQPSPNGPNDPRFSGDPQPGPVGAEQTPANQAPPAQPHPGPQPLLGTQGYPAQQGASQSPPAPGQYGHPATPGQQPYQPQVQQPQGAQPGYQQASYPQGYPQGQQVPGYAQPIGQQAPQVPGYAQPIGQQAPQGGYYPPNYGQPPFVGGQPLYQGAGGQPPSKGPKILPLVLVGLLVIALAIGGIWWIQRSQGQPTRTIEPAPTVPVVPTLPVRPTTTATPTVASKFIPGPGTYTTIKAYLVGKGFECVDEKLKGVSATICLLRGNPEATVYVAGLPNGRLGRLVMSVNQQVGSDRHREIQRHLLMQFLHGDAAAVDAALAAFAKGTSQKYARWDKEGIYAYGAPNGALVIEPNGWMPADLRFPGVAVTKDEFATMAAGYKCEDVSDGQDCRRTEGTTKYTLSLRMTGDLTTRVSLTVRGIRSSTLFNTEFTKLLTPLGAKAAPYLAVVKGFGFKDGYYFAADGILVDYVQSIKGKTPTDEVTAVTLYTSCLANHTSWC